MQKKYIALFIGSLIVFSFMLIQFNVELKGSEFGSFTSYDLDQVYLLSMHLDQKSPIPIKLVAVEITDENGNKLVDSELPFEWRVWIDNESTVGAIRISENEIENKEDNVPGYKISSEKIKLVKYIKRIRKTVVDEEYYIKITYKLWGIKHHEIYPFVSM